MGTLQNIETGTTLLARHPGTGRSEAIIAFQDHALKRLINDINRKKD